MFSREAFERGRLQSAGRYSGRESKVELERGCGANRRELRHYRAGGGTSLRGQGTGCRLRFLVLEPYPRPRFGDESGDEYVDSRRLQSTAAL